MEGAISTLVQELAKMGPSALPWTVNLVVIALAFFLIRWLVMQLLDRDKVIMGLLQESAKADKDQAVEYRRLVDVVQQGRRSQ